MFVVFDVPYFAKSSYLPFSYRIKPPFCLSIPAHDIFSTHFLWLIYTFHSLSLTDMHISAINTFVTVNGEVTVRSVSLDHCSIQVALLKWFILVKCTYWHEKKLLGCQLVIRVVSLWVIFFASTSPLQRPKCAVSDWIDYWHVSSDCLLPCWVVTAYARN
jgi:hypothetical protein